MLLCCAAASLVARMVQTSAKETYSLVARCSLSFAKIMKGECNSIAGKQSFTGFDIAEPHLIFCKDTPIF